VDAEADILLDLARLRAAQGIGMKHCGWHKRRLSSPSAASMSCRRGRVSLLAQMALGAATSARRWRMRGRLAAWRRAMARRITLQGGV